MKFEGHGGLHTRPFGSFGLTKRTSAGTSQCWGEIFLRRPLAGVVLALVVVGASTSFAAPGKPVPIRCASGDVIYTRIAGHGTWPVVNVSPVDAVHRLMEADYPFVSDVNPTPIAIARAHVTLAAEVTQGSARSIWEVEKMGSSWIVTRFTACNEYLGGNPTDSSIHLLPKAADEEGGSPFYSTKWTGSDLTIDWRFTDTFPSGPMRKIAVAATQHWNDLAQPLRFAFDPEAEDFETFPTSSCPAADEKGRNALHFGDMPGGGAFTIACTYTNPDGTDSGRMHSFQIKFSDNTNWYVGKKSPKYGQEDFLSYAVHEFGHGTGRINGGDGNGHFKDSSSDLCAPRASVHHTMCQTAPNHTKYDRTLNHRDKAEFTDSY